MKEIGKRMKNDLIHNLTESFEDHGQKNEKELSVLILKAKDFATEITIHNAREQAMGHEQQISQEHVTNNEAVRKTLISRGIRPEGLPPAEDVKKVERRLTSAEKNAIENPDALEE